MLRAEFRELLEFGVIIFFIGLCVGLMLSIVFPPYFGNVLEMIASFVKNARGIAAIAGDRPPRYGIRNGLGYRRARACPSPCHERGGNPFGCACGTLRGPRATVSSTVAFSVCSLRSTDRKRPRAVLNTPPPFTVGRGPVPRPANRLNQDSQDDRICRIISRASAKSLLKKTALQVL